MHERRVVGRQEDLQIVAQRRGAGGNRREIVGQVRPGLERRHHPIERLTGRESNVVQAANRRRGHRHAITAALALPQLEAGGVEQLAAGMLDVRGRVRDGHREAARIARQGSGGLRRVSHELIDPV